MKIGRFEHISTSKKPVIHYFVWVLSLFIICSLIPTGHAQTETSNRIAPQNQNDAVLEPKLKELLTTVYCYCGCERETIEVCVCVTADRIEDDFRNRLLAGQTVEQIRTNYLDTFGPQFYAVMPAEGINLLAYIMPAVILVLIGGVAFAVLRKSRQQTMTSDGLEGPKRQISDITVQQVEAELERYKRQN